MLSELSVHFFLFTVSFIVGVTCVCPKFTVYDNLNNEIGDNGVCLNLYTTPKCLPFYTSFDQSNLPSGFPTWDFLSDSVEKPEDIKVVGIETPMQDWTVPGFNITWTPPMSGASRKNCYGYLVIWYNNITDIKCRLLQLTPANSTKLRYKFTVDAVDEKADYTIRIYSVPTYELEAKDDKRKFAVAKIATMDKYQYPANWAPSITYEPHENGTISVSFSLPPPQFNITQFRLFLNKIRNNWPDFFMEKNYTLPLRTDEMSEFSTSISTTVSDNYSITVWAVDDYRNTEGLCKCYILQNGVKQCENICGGTETSPFFLNITDDLTKTTSTRSPVSSSVGGEDPPQTSISDEDPEAAGTTLIVVIICVVVVVTLLVLVISACLYKHRGDVKEWISKWGNPPPGAKEPLKDQKPIDKQPAKVGNLAKKTVYIISADDHEAQVKLVESFANFLKVHCHCNVIQPSDSSNHIEATYEWFIKSISGSNYIIFVDSLAAEKRFEAYINKLTDDANNFFQFGLQYLMVADNKLRTESLIHVTFNGNKNSYCRLKWMSSNLYTLPDHIPQLLHKIHELDNTKANNLQNVLPLIKDNIPTLPEGERITSALKDVEYFEKKNPNWLKQALGKPLYERLLSGDSGCPSSITPEEDPLDSVSQCSRPESPFAGYEATAPFTEDDFSNVVTIAEGKGMDESEDRTKESKLGDGVVPPLKVSDFDNMSDGISQLMNQINKNSEIPYSQNFVSSANSSHQPGYYAPRDGDQNFMQRLNSNARADRSDAISVVPPVNLYDLQVDSISTALDKFNLDNASTALSIVPKTGISTTLIDRNQNGTCSALANINLGFDDSTEFDDISTAFNQRNGNSNVDPVPMYLHLDNGNISHPVSTDNRTAVLPININTNYETRLLDQHSVYLHLPDITNECSDCDAAIV